MQIKKQSMNINSVNSFTYQFLKNLINQTFQGVGLQNSKRMAPKNTQIQAMNILQSFVKVAFTQKYIQQQKLIAQNDPKTAWIDNLAILEVNVQDQKHNPSQACTTPMQNRSTVKSKTIHTQKSHRSRKGTPSLQTQTKSRLITQSKFQKLPQLIQEQAYVPTQKDKQLQKIRDKFLRFEKQEKQRCLQLNKIEIQNEKERQKKIKSIKDIKRLTYDYEGKLFSQGNGISQPQKLMYLNKNLGDNRKIKFRSKAIQTAQVQLAAIQKQQKAQKISKDIPMFRQQAQSIIDSIQKAKGIAQGVKIIQTNGEKSNTKQNPLKRSQNNSLLEFKTNQTKYKDFLPKKGNFLHSKNMNEYVNNEQVDYSIQSNNDVLLGARKQPFKTLNKLASVINPKQTKSKSTYTLITPNPILNDSSSRLIQSTSLNPSSLNQSRSKNRSKQFYQYKGLPFIKTKGYKAIDFASQKSFKIKDNFNTINNQQNKIKNRINVKDFELFHNTIDEI